MRRRGIGRRGPGLAGTMARTAVIAGTATAVSGAVHNKQAAAAQAQAQPQTVYVEAAPPPPPAPAAPAAASSDAIAQLKELAALKEQGILTEEEFAVQKARLLG